MRRLVVVSLLLTACSDEVPMLPGMCGSDVIPVAIVAHHHVPMHAVEAAADMWGDVVFVDWDRSYETCMDGCLGTITIFEVGEILYPTLADARHAVDDEGRIQACEIRLDPIWEVSAEVLAHEIGHCLGLAHTHHEESVMHDPVIPGSHVTDAERQRAREGCSP